MGSHFLLTSLYPPPPTQQSLTKQQTYATTQTSKKGAHPAILAHTAQSRMKITTSSQHPQNCAILAESAALSAAGQTILAKFQAPARKRMVERILRDGFDPKKLNKKLLLIARSTILEAYRAALTSCKNGVTASDPILARMAVTSGQPASTGPDGCFSNNRAVCYEHNVTMIGQIQFSITTLDPIRVWTENLTAVQAPALDVDGQFVWQTSTPDTMLALLKCNDPQCLSGDVIDVNDDGNSTSNNNFASRIAITPIVTGIYKVLIFAFEVDDIGRADVVLGHSDQAESTTNLFFGGRRWESKEIRSEDRIFIGRNNDGSDDDNVGTAYTPVSSEYHDSTVWVVERFIDGCGTAGCGRFIFNDDLRWAGPSAPDTVLLSSIKIPANWASSNSVVLSGVFHETAGTAGLPHYMSQRVMHQRTATSDGGSWLGGDHVDRDGDGLTVEIEQALGTCDDVTSSWPLAVGFAGATCATYQTFIDGFLDNCPDPAGLLPKCWSPRDSDNDGLEDGWETFAVRFSCTTPVTGPQGTVGSCTPLSIHDSTCAPAANCMAEPLSARSDPDPTVYDMYAMTWSFGCSGPRCQAEHTVSLPTGAYHAVYQVMQVQLSRIAAVEPQTCIDGSLDAADATTTCPMAEDRRYFVNLHTYNLSILAMLDDTASAEIVGGNTITRALYNARFSGAMRHGGLSRMVLLSHFTGGQATTNVEPTSGFLAMNVGNATTTANVPIMQNVGSEATNFMHELGHTLTLDHTFDTDGQKQSGGCPNTIACSPRLMSCVVDGTTCAVYRERPTQHTLMTARYNIRHGMRAKSDGAPGAGEQAFSGCAWENSRFSKGLNLPIFESALSETLDQTNLTLRSELLTAGMACWSSINMAGSQCGGNAWTDRSWGFALFNTMFTAPFCNGTSCFINWDQQGLSPTTNPYTLDLSFNHWDPALTCNSDILDDNNEWGMILARGKQILQWARGGKATFMRYAIYLDTFNGFDGINGQTWAFNQAGWDFPIQLSAALPSEGNGIVATFPINSCDNATDCAANQVCHHDAPCSQPTDCRNPVQGCGADSVCRCLTDIHCFSGSCVAGRCVVSATGVCGCTAATDCIPTPGNVVGNCTVQAGLTSICAGTSYPSSRISIAGANMGASAHQEMLQFDGPGSSHGLTLDRQGNDTTNPLGSIGNGALGETDRFDFYWEGFAPNQTTAVIMQSAGVRIAFIADANGNPQMEVSFTGLPGGQGAPDPITVGDSGGDPSINFGWQARRWYRISITHAATWYGSPPEFGYLMLQVQPWDLRTGYYKSINDLTSSICATIVGSWTLPSGDMHFGFDGITNATRMVGRVDNISVLNFPLVFPNGGPSVDPTTTPPTTCTQL